MKSKTYVNSITLTDQSVEMAGDQAAEVAQDWLSDLPDGWRLIASHVTVREWEGGNFPRSEGGGKQQEYNLLLIVTVPMPDEYDSPLLGQ